MEVRRPFGPASDPPAASASTRLRPCESRYALPCASRCKCLPLARTLSDVKITSAEYGPLVMTEGLWDAITLNGKETEQRASGDPPASCATSIAEMNTGSASAIHRFIANFSVA